MTIPLDYRPRKGDVLLIEAVVKYDSDDDKEKIHVKVDYNSFVVERKSVVGLARPHFEVGETVNFLTDTPPIDFEVIAIRAGWAWLMSCDNANRSEITTLEKLRLADVQREKINDDAE